MLKLATKKKITLLVVIIFLLLLYCIRTTKLNNNNIQNKIDYALSKDYLISLGIVPVFDDESIKYEMIDILNCIERQNTMYKKSLYSGNKASIKIRQLSKNKFEELKFIVDYANKKNIFIWIAAMLPEDLDDEYNFYIKLLNEKYKNVGLTLATYNKSCSKKVDNILKLGGHVRLVKGVYYGDIDDWKHVTENYKKNALKLIRSNNYHTLATHDYKLLKELKQLEPINFDNIELAFYYSALKFISTFEKEFINKKSLYIHFGNKLHYLYDNAYYINFHRFFQIPKKYLLSGMLKLSN